MASNASILDRYIPGQSAVHTADARIKLVITLSFIAALSSFPPGSWGGLAIMGCLVWAAALLSGVGPLRVLRRSFIALPFAAVAVPSMFSRPGDELFALPLGFATLTATDDGLLFVVSILLKSWMSVTAAALLTATTPFTEIIHALRALRVPSVLVAIFTFMYRYLFVLVEEAQRLLRARSARSAASGTRAGGPMTWRAKVAGGMAGSLFIRTFDRSERVYMAMLARGFDGEIRLPSTRRLDAGAYLQGAAGVAVAAITAVAVRFT
ncbi:MAG: cobalt ECF transporter T component CbiQ [Dehalococcoidia bacterium]